ncbi:MAG TPA: ABC transporter permease [Candidatus Dormibacteraeota bacterium]|jgi:peptide/nickel transport system permease protein|nr:ABC transporter permease [Candidatus Dormibacteraeota bacterium]
MADLPAIPSPGPGGAVAGITRVETILDQEREAAPLTVDELASAPELGFWKLAAIRFLHHRVATASLLVLVLIGLAALVVPILQGDLYRVQDYTHPYGPPFQSFQHILGTDDLGRDVLARLIRGARVSLEVGLLAMVGYLIVGGSLGAIAGYYGGFLDNLLMRFTDLIIAMPFILVVVAVTAAFGGVSLNKLVLVIALTGWYEIGRLMRAQFLVLRESEFVQAARALGASDWRIITRHILPNSLAPIIVSATLGVSGIILLEAALGFLGYSIPPPEPSWGNMLNEFQDYLLRNQVYLVAFPSIALVITALCINLVGDGIRDALDPRQR